MATTRSSSRLRDVRIKAEQTEATPSNLPPPPIGTATGTTKTRSSLRSTTTTTSTRSSRRIVKNEDGEPDEETLARLKLEAEDLRQALASDKTKQNKRSNSAMKSNGSVKKEPSEAESTVVKKSKYATKEPAGWEITLDRLREFRLQNPAPVDTMGCERLAEVGEHIPPEVSRFQTLMALVLSSQTKDTVTSVAVRKLQKELKGGLTIQGVLDVPSEELNSIIGAVGFHNKKTIFMKQVAEICKTKYNGDIPDTAEELIALPGVGPKMAYLTLQCAWNKNLGIGVDTHVHRISNRLGWVKTEKDGPEATREALQSWLPKEHWREINHIMVGFGQVLCLPRGPLCATCPIQERCPSATVISKQRKRAIKEERVKVEIEMEQPFGEVELHEVHVHKDLQEAEGKKDVVPENGQIKEEEGIDDTKSPFFSTGEGQSEIKKEPEDVNPEKGSVLKVLHADAGKLGEEDADIEDLVP
ncbi:DNA N-glycosylase and apurinic/apyrimidinic (AP) lyase [Mortierella sp. GBA30]|nr:DNA N-glycosylase and apurinic/apyrimidinic (AP) lyase [Mortierella sp. GBA30]